jgi:hypothetical protein
MDYEHLVIFGGVCAATWLLFIYLWPSFIIRVYKRAILVKGFGEGPVPINTLYTESQELFADPVGMQSASGSNSATAGMNRDTLYVVGWLDLSKGAQVLHVPEMAARYYSVQFTDPSQNVNFAYVGKRTTGTKAGDYLITGANWQGAVPPGMSRLSSPSRAVLVVGRVFVENDDDLPTAHALAKQIRLTPADENANVPSAPSSKLLGKNAENSPK